MVLFGLNLCHLTICILDNILLLWYVCFWTSWISDKRGQSAGPPPDLAKRLESRRPPGSPSLNRSSASSAKTRISQRRHLKKVEKEETNNAIRKILSGKHSRPTSAGRFNSSRASSRKPTTQGILGCDKESLEISNKRIPRKERIKYVLFVRLLSLFRQLHFLNITGFWFYWQFFLKFLFPFSGMYNFYFLSFDV